MKKLIFVCMLLLAGLTFAQAAVDPVPVTPEMAGQKVPFTDTVLITAALAASILTITQGLKRLLESPLLKWVLTLIGHAEVVPFIGVAISIVTAVIAGLVTYGADGITIAEMLSIITAWTGSIGGFSLIQKASGLPSGLPKGPAQ